MLLDYDNTRTNTSSLLGPVENVENRSPEELFRELFEKQMGRPMTNEQAEYIGQILRDLQEDEG